MHARTHPPTHTHLYDSRAARGGAREKPLVYEDALRRFDLLLYQAPAVYKSYISLHNYIFTPYEDALRRFDLLLYRAPARRTRFCGTMLYCTTLSYNIVHYNDII